MPFAIALLDHQAGVYAFLVVAIAGLAYGGATRRFVPIFAGAAAALLTALAFLTAPPRPDGLLLLGLGVALMALEFRLPTYGVAGLAGYAAAFAGSLALLAPPPPREPMPIAWAGAAALVGTSALLCVLYRMQRRLAQPR